MALSDPVCDPFEACDGGAGVRLYVRVTPKAANARLGGVQPSACGRGRLKVAVTDAPEDGKANAAVIRLIAKTLRLAKSEVALTTGAGDRNKTLLLLGDASDLMRRLHILAYGSDAPGQDTG